MTLTLVCPQGYHEQPIVQTLWQALYQDTRSFATELCPALKVQENVTANPVASCPIQDALDAEYEAFAQSKPLQQAFPSTGRYATREILTPSTVSHSRYTKSKSPMHTWYA